MKSSEVSMTTFKKSSRTTMTTSFFPMSLAFFTCMILLPSMVDGGSFLPAWPKTTTTTTTAFIFSTTTTTTTTTMMIRNNACYVWGISHKPNTAPNGLRRALIGGSCLKAKKSNKEQSSSSNKNKANHIKWQPFYEQLVEFKAKYGHCNVLQVIEEDDENKTDMKGSSLGSLATWYQDQLQSYQKLQMKQKTKLTKKRATALEQLGAIPPDYL